MTAPNDEGPTVAAVGLQGVAQSVSHHCAPDDAQRKAFETLRAAAAIKGYCLARSDSADGPVAYFATRWGLVRELRDLAAVAAFVLSIGGSV